MILRNVLNISLFVLVYIICYKALGAQEECNKLGAHFYQDLSCNPVGNKSCPEKFDCDFTLPTNSCVFAGENYLVGEQINDTLISSACHVGCRCRSEPGSSPFICEEFHCPEWNGTSNMAKFGCYDKFETGKCCRIEEVCAEEWSPIHKCTVDNKLYKDGQRFYPEGTCLECVCHKGFNDTFEEPTCKKMVCAEQIYNSAMLAENCAVYYKAVKGDVVCCPDGYVCEKGNEEIKEVASNVTSEITCRFGKRDLKIGQEFESEFINIYSSDISKVYCECKLPPLVTCWKYLPSKY